MSVTNIYDAVYPVLITTAFFGLSSILVRVQNNTPKLKLYNILKILNIAYISAFSYLLYSALSDFKNQQLQANYAFGVSKIGIVFQLIAQITLAYILYIINISKSPEILSSIEDIKIIDDIFKDLGETSNYSNHFNFEVFVISFGFIAILSKAVLSYIYIGNNIFATQLNPHFVLSVPTFVSYLVQNNFALLIKLLHERFNLINKLLYKIINKNPNSIYTQLKASEEYDWKNVKNIEKIMELHDYLTDVGNNLNDSFSVQILCCLTAQFLTEVFTVFYVYYESLVLKNKLYALIWAIWTAWTSIEIFFVTIICHLTCKEAKNTGVVIHKVLVTQIDSEIKRKLMVFSQQIWHRPLQFTACGLFPIDATLIFTIAGAAATYLLIMLQFQEGIEAQCSNITRS